MDWQFHFADANRDAFLGWVRHTPESRNMTAIEASGRASAAMMAVLDAELARQPWLTGESFGIADIPMGVYTHTYFTLPLERPALPALTEWYGRLRQRPAFAEQVMIPLT